MLEQIMDIALIVLVAAVVIALFFLIKLFMKLSSFINDVQKEIIPSLHMLQNTVEEVNGELAKMDSIMASVQGVTDKVNSTTKIAQEVISSPLIKFASFTYGAQRAVGRFLKKK